ncbi:hypothetical protein CDD83_6531 [Cordyceps sp. RAO-2017]|nr:hypothetical protein CDD83_6531 [Cordyceps sp. RAO-2017]
MRGAGWFVEEPPPSDDEEAWIRGGIGVEGDSGAAVVDASTSCLVGQVWGRNRYWGPGPRLAFFTPIADLFDDIQEKCGLQSRPRLPQHRDDGDRYPVYPSCRRCYDQRAYLDSRRSSRASLQSMIMYADNVGRDSLSLEPRSELTTPRDFPHGNVVEQVGASFTNALSPGDGRLGPGTPLAPTIASDIRSPYPPELELDDVLDPRPGLGGSTAKRSLQSLDAMASDVLANECRPPKRHNPGW